MQRVLHQFVKAIRDKLQFAILGCTNKLLLDLIGLLTLMFLVSPHWLKSYGGKVFYVMVNISQASSVALKMAMSVIKAPIGSKSPMNIGGIDIKLCI